MTTVPTARKVSAGFSMIELLITVSILLLITGGGIAAMVSFNDRQAVREAAKTLQATLKGAQTKAKIGDLPETCFNAGEKLEGYEVRLQSGSPVVTVLAQCSTQTVVSQQFTLQNAVQSASNINVTFLPLYGGVEGATTVTLSRNNLQYQFAVTNEGEITEGELQ